MAQLSLKAAQKILDDNVSPWVRELGMKVEAMDGGDCHIRVPFDSKLVHSGGVICGQTFMSVADAGAMLSIVATLGEMPPMATVSLNISFMKGAADTDLLAHCITLKAGRRMVFGETNLYAGDLTQPVAQAQTNYMVTRD